VSTEPTQDAVPHAVPDGRCWYEQPVAALQTPSSQALSGAQSSGAGPSQRNDGVQVSAPMNTDPSHVALPHCESLPPQHLPLAQQNPFAQ
jgi:hypothetical protein